MAMRRAIFIPFSFSDVHFVLPEPIVPHSGDMAQLSGDTRLGDNGELTLRRLV